MMPALELSLYLGFGFGVPVSLLITREIKNRFTLRKSSKERKEV